MIATCMYIVTSASRITVTKDLGTCRKVFKEGNNQISQNLEANKTMITFFMNYGW